MHLFKSLFVFFIFLFISQLSIAQSVQIIDMGKAGSQLAASEFADSIIEKARSQNIGTESAPILVYHVGNTIPKNLDWTILKLKRAGLHVQLEKISPQEIENKWENGFSDNLDFVMKGSKLRVPPNSPLAGVDLSAHHQRNFSVAKRNVALGIKKLFGLPNGITFWFPIKRSAEEKRANLYGALFSASTAGISISLAFYGGIAGQKLVELAGQTENVTVFQQLKYAMMLPSSDMAFIAGAVVGLASWVYMNMYWLRSVQEVMNQGQLLHIDKNYNLSIKSKAAFLYTTNFLRALITNVMIIGGAYMAVSLGDILFFDYSKDVWTELNARWLSTDALYKILENSLLTVFARTQIDKWITDKTPKDINGVTVQSGHQWSVKTAGRARVFWEFFFGFSKNLHLVNLGWAGDLIFYSILTVNNVMLMKEKANHSNFSFNENIYTPLARRLSRRIKTQSMCYQVFATR